MSEPYDILVQNATIVDGSGQPAYTGSVGIVGEKIVAVGETGDTAALIIDGRGLIACPGFVDPHSHNAHGRQPGDAGHHYLFGRQLWL